MWFTRPPYNAQPIFRNGTFGTTALKRRTLGNDIRGDFIFDEGDPVLECQLLLFHALKPQGIQVAGQLHRFDGDIEIAMLAFEHFQFDPKYVVMIHSVGHVHRVVSICFSGGFRHRYWWGVICFNPTPNFSKLKALSDALLKLALQVPYLNQRVAAVGAFRANTVASRKGRVMTKVSFGAHPFLLGFDQLERLVERTAKSDAGSYPPYNIEQSSDHTYRITLAVAGFSDADLSITLEDRQLVVRGRQAEDEEARVFLHRGIAGRQFQRAFVLADGVDVTGASTENGLLHIDLRRAVAESVVQTIQIRKG